MRGATADFDVAALAREIAGDVDPVVLLLVAMLSDEIVSLARLYRVGAWREDTSQIADWLRRGAPGGHNILIGEARMEFSLQTEGVWSALLRVLARETDVRIDRSRVVRLAREMGQSEGGYFRGGVGGRTPKERRVA